MTDGSSEAIHTLTENETSQSSPPSAEPKNGLYAHAWLSIAFAVFTVAWGGNEFTPLLVFYKEEAVFSPVFIDSLLASYAIGIALSLPLSGALSDRYGRRLVMLPAPLVAIVGSTLIALGETSEVPMSMGRFIVGIAVGMAMVAGGTWIKELSSPAFDPNAHPHSHPEVGAKRSTMALTGGFALGAGVAGVLAQWAPFPGQLPYVVHAIFSIIAFAGMLSIPETRHSSASSRKKGTKGVNGDASDSATDNAGEKSSNGFRAVFHPRFLTIVFPVAPWVFGAGGVAYAIMPTLARSEVGQPIAFSALLTVGALGVGFIAQQYVYLIARPDSARGSIAALICVIIGMSLAIYTAGHINVWSTLSVSLTLGLGYGLCLITGLQEVQRIASPDELGSLTAVYYMLAYIGFFFPMILTKLSSWLSYEFMFGFGVMMACLALSVVVFFSKKNIPADREEDCEE